MATGLLFLVYLFLLKKANENKEEETRRVETWEVGDIDLSRSLFDEKVGKKDMKVREQKSLNG